VVGWLGAGKEGGLKKEEELEREGV